MIDSSINQFNSSAQTNLSTVFQTFYDWAPKILIKNKKIYMCIYHIINSFHITVLRQLLVSGIHCNDFTLIFSTRNALEYEQNLSIQFRMIGNCCQSQSWTTRVKAYIHFKTTRVVLFISYLIIFVDSLSTYSVISKIK